MVKQLAEAYRAGARSRGRNPALGEGVGLCRTFHFTKSKDEIYNIVEKYEAPVWTGWYAPFGFMEGSRLPGEEGPVPKPGEHLADRLMKSGLLIAGTVDDVKRQLDGLLKEVPLDYLVWLFHWGLIPRDEGLEQLELFATKIMPEFGMKAPSPEHSLA
jgi:alkanesulfonate monooxygenase SsuD/methylene tetrahydromethanopterin reductase-like flavin-dependent oxidoreductase (luciferase family)